jgi:hypothetical protein
VNGNFMIRVDIERIRAVFTNLERLRSTVHRTCFRRVHLFNETTIRQLKYALVTVAVWVTWVYRKISKTISCVCSIQLGSLVTGARTFIWLVLFRILSYF